MSSNKLTDTQLVLLSAASERTDGTIELAGDRKGQKAIRKLLDDGLVEEIPAGGVPAWRRDDDQGPLALRIGLFAGAELQRRKGGTNESPAFAPG
jgi:hypothetical protein